MKWYEKLALIFAFGLSVYLSAIVIILFLMYQVELVTWLLK